MYVLVSQAARHPVASLQAARHANAFPPGVEHWREAEEPLSAPVA